MIPEIVAMRDRFHRAIDNRRIHLFFNKADLDRRFCKFVENLLLPKAKSEECDYISEKTPSNILYFCQLMQIFPSAKFLFVLRDPIAVVASLCRVRQKYRSRNLKPPRYIRNVFASIDYIRACIEAGFTAYKTNPERVMIVLYERLVRDPKRIVNDVCRHIGIPWDSAMLVPGKKRHQGEVTIDGIWYDKKSYYRNIDCTSLYRRSKTLTQREHYAVYCAFRSIREITESGYCREAPSLRTNDKLMYALTSQIWKIYRDFRRRIPIKLLVID